MDEKKETVDNEGDGTEKEEPEVEEVNEETIISEDTEENDLLNELMKKIENAGMLDEEIDSDLSEFTERVEDVVDSVVRIENIERTSMEEKFLFRSDGEEEDIETDEVAGSQPVEVTGETQSEGVIGEGIELPDVIGQIHVGAPSPYKEVSDGGLHPDERGNLVTHYRSDALEVLDNLKRLIEIKLSKSKEDEARKFLDLAISIGEKEPSFKNKFNEILDRFGVIIDVPVEITETMIEERETNVLDPDLADNIDILQKKARSAIEQLGKQIERTEIPPDELREIRNDLAEARDLFHEKRFHKSYNTALHGLKIIKNQAQDYLDNKVQDTLFEAKKMIEEVESKEKPPEEKFINDLKLRMDKAMKAYLTNEYERSNLLAKRIIESIRDLGELEGTPAREVAKNLKTQLEKIKEKNVFNEETSELSALLATANDLIKRKDGLSAKKILDQCSTSIAELEDRSDKYVNSREMEIRITNRLERLQDTDHDLSELTKKLDFLKEYMSDGRFEDAIEIGSDMEKELGTFEKLRTNTVVKSTIEKLGAMMEHVEEMEDSKKVKERFDSIQTAFEMGDIATAESDAEDLLLYLKNRMKTLSVERARRIASSIIEIKILTLKMNSLNIDSTNVERKLRNIKNNIKDGDRGEGLSRLDELVHEIKSDLKDHMDKLKTMTRIHRDSLEVIMDRHRDQPVIFHVRNRHVPILRMMEDMGKFQSAIEEYRKLSSKFAGLKLPEDKKNGIETELTECKFEIYKRKEEGMDISEPLKLYTTAQKKFTSGQEVPAEYLVEISRRYCDSFLPLNTS